MRPVERRWWCAATLLTIAFVLVTELRSRPLSSFGSGKDDERAMVERAGISNTLILIGCNYGYYDFALNFMCQMRHLGITNVVFSPFDARMHSAALSNPDLVVVPREKEQDKKNMRDDYGYNSVEAAEWGTKEFREIVQHKSVEVLRLLKLGVNVMWSDVDIYFLRDPLEDILKAMANTGADLAVQSNAPVTERSLNGIRRINSGFYYIKSTKNTIETFERIVSHVYQSRETEQPSFYAILCGTSGEHRVGNNKCSNDLVTTVFLDRRKYPHGGIYWMSDEDKKRHPQLVAPNPFIAHANWVKGRETKQDMLVQKGFWKLTRDWQCTK